MRFKSPRGWQVGLYLATALTAGGAAITSGCATHDGPALSGYTCCNFHYDRDYRKAGTLRRPADRYWISDANWSSLPMISAGTPIRTKSYSQYDITVDVDVIYTQEMHLGLDFGRGQDLAEWARRMIVEDDPRIRIVRWEPSVQRAIRAGKVAIGMTQEQVIVSLGYPPAHETPSLQAERWKYWYGNFDTYLVVWDDQRRVREVLADPETRAAVVAGN